MPEGCFDLGKGLGECIRLQPGAQLAGDLREREDSAHPFFVRAALRHQEDFSGDQCNGAYSRNMSGYSGKSPLEERLPGIHVSPAG